MDGLVGCVWVEFSDGGCSVGVTRSGSVSIDNLASQAIFAMVEQLFDCSSGKASDSCRRRERGGRDGGSWASFVDVTNN